MKPLLKLLANNRGRGTFRAESDGEKATVFIYDVIVADDFWGGVSAENFVKEMMGIKAKEIHLRINSPGGDVFAARAMEQAIKEHPAKVVAHIDGYAASAASILAIAADETVISEGGFYMIHKAWTLAMGNSDDLMETAALLEKVDSSLVKTYANKTGLEAEQIEEWMKAETWFTAEEAVEHGFCLAVDEPAPKAQGWDLAAYKSPPKAEEAPKAEELTEEEPAKAVPDTQAMRRKLALKAA